MAERSGVDLIIRGKDDTAKATASAARNVAKLEKEVETVGGKIGKSIGAQLVGGIAAGFGAQAIDNLFREINAAQAAGKTGADLAEALASSFANTLESIPVAGSIGKFLAVNVFDPLTGGTMVQEEARKAAMKAGEAVAAAGESFDRIIGSIDDDQRDPITAKIEGIRERANAELAKIAQGGGKIGERRDQLNQELAALEQRLRATEELRRAEEQRAEEERAASEVARANAEARRDAEKQAEQAARDAAAADSQRMRTAQQVLARVNASREDELGLSQRLAGALEAGQVNTAALRFRQERASALNTPTATAKAQLKEQQLATRVLDDMLRESREQSAALERIANSQQVLEITQL